MIFKIKLLPKIKFVKFVVKNLIILKIATKHILFQTNHKFYLIIINNSKKINKVIFKNYR